MNLLGIGIGFSILASVVIFGFLILLAFYFYKQAQKEDEEKRRQKIEQLKKLKEKQEREKEKAYADFKKNELNKKKYWINKLKSENPILSVDTLISFSWSQRLYSIDNDFYKYDAAFFIQTDKYIDLGDNAVATPDALIFITHFEGVGCYKNYWHSCCYGKLLWENIYNFSYETENPSIRNIPHDNIITTSKPTAGMGMILSNGMVITNFASEPQTSHITTYSQELKTHKKGIVCIYHLV